MTCLYNRVKALNSQIKKDAQGIDNYIKRIKYYNKIY
jgi:hypothetical protein